MGFRHLSVFNIEVIEFHGLMAFGAVAIAWPYGLARRSGAIWYALIIHTIIFFSMVRVDFSRDQFF